MIHAFASEVHFLQHLVPIWEALYPDQRGEFWVRPELLHTAAALQLDAKITHSGPGGTGPIMVASFHDLRAAKDRPVIFVEHGAGQTYGGSHPNYPGGPGRERVILFICPSDRVAALNRAAYPDIPVVAVGVPKLDNWHSGRFKPTGGAVAVSFHWDCQICPEARSALEFYEVILPELANSFREVIGHGHPRIFDRLLPIYERAGIEPVRNFAEVLDRASVYACDNSSTLYEFASTDRPVVVFNAPWYRRAVNHGLRFWDQADIGLRCEDPSELVPMIHLARIDLTPIKERRREIIAQVYEACDGNASQRAAAAIAQLTAPAHA